MIDEAFSAARQGDWPLVHSLLSPVATSGENAPGQLLQLFAFATYKVGSLDDACQLMERAFARCVAEGQPKQAVLCAAYLVALYEVEGVEAAMSGWEQRGMRLVAEIGPCVEEGYIALCRTGCQIADPKELASRADRALELALQFGDRNLELRARAEKGLALVSQGFVNAGFALLDEVMAAVMSGEFADAEMRCRSVCSVLSACERVGDVARIDYWCERIEREPALEHPVLVSHCRMVYGFAEALRGQWESAETHLTQAMQSDSAVYGHRAASAGRLAEIRLQQGKRDEAAALLRGYEDAIEAITALARLRVEEGRADLAAALLRSAVRSLGDDTLRLAPILLLAIEVDLLRDNPAVAERWRQRLLVLEGRCESNEIRAHVRWAGGRMARHRGDAEMAIEELEIALTLLTHYDRPLLVARIRLELARAFAAAGEQAGAAVEAEAAAAIFVRLGLLADAAAAEALSSRPAPSGEKSAPPLEGSVPAPALASDAAELTVREREVAQLVAQGLTNREIAERLVLSVRTVEGHVDRILGKLNLRTRTQLAVRLSDPATEPR